MMKKIFFLLILLLLFSVLTGGCAEVHTPVPGEIKETESEAESETESAETAVQPSPVFAEQLAGRYRYDSVENGMTVVEIYYVDGTLIAEAEQEYAAYFAAELIPDDPAVLNSNAAENTDFTAYAFSGFSGFGEYWEDTPKITVSLTESGLMLTEPDGSTVEILRDDTLEPIHIANRYAEHLPEEAGEGLPEGMIGTWMADYFGGYRIMLRMNGDGTLLLYCKKEGEPVDIMIGCCAVTKEADEENGLLTVIAECVGHGAMPWQGTLEYDLTDTGILTLKNSEADGFLPMEDDVALIQNDEKE